MSIAVQFPDGSVRHVPGQLREIEDAAHPGGPPLFEQVPLNCSSLWRYYRSGKGWFARPRSGHLAAFRAPADEWWRPVAAMADEDSPSPRFGSAA
jgi:hypothetical protein